MESHLLPSPVTTSSSSIPPNNEETDTPDDSIEDSPQLAEVEIDPFEVHRADLRYFIDEHRKLMVNDTIAEMVTTDRIWAVSKLMTGQKPASSLAGVIDKSFKPYKTRAEMVRVFSVALSKPYLFVERALTDPKPAQPATSATRLSGGAGHCCACDIFITNQSALHTHYLRAHPIEYYELYECRLCHHWFRIGVDCVAHVRDSHRDTHLGDVNRILGFCATIFNKSGDTEFETPPPSGLWHYKSKTGTVHPPTKLYNCRLCTSTFLRAILVHYHLMTAHGVVAALLPQFYAIVDRSNDGFNQDDYEEMRYAKERKESRSKAEVERLWFLCYLCGCVLGQEIDLKAHLVGRHGARPPIRTVVVNDHMVFR